eukprot:8586050-Heterocapsa_arctica.AAC.1
MVNPDGYAEYDNERAANHPGSMTSPSSYRMNNDDSEEDDDEAEARQNAANVLSEEYFDFVPAFSVE